MGSLWECGVCNCTVGVLVLPEGAATSPSAQGDFHSVIHSVLMKHARLLHSRDLGALCLPRRSVQDPEQQVNLCPCGGKKAAPEPVMRYFPSHSEQRCLNKVVSKGQPVQARPAIYLALGLLSITFQMHWLPSLAGLSLT